MADLLLNINGNASGAKEAFDDAGAGAEALGDAVGKSAVKWQELADLSKKALEAVVRFGVDAVKAYAESERVQRQLTRVAGEYTDALEAQAEALGKLNAVDDDVIKQSEMLLTQWGGVGAATRDVEQAVLDYAAATGQDAVSATQSLIRNVETGGAQLAKMGVHFEATGGKGKDLAAAVAALSKKFGGAGETDAGSLSGSLRGVTLAFDDFQKAVGAGLGGLLEKSGVLSTVTGMLRDMATGAKVVSAALADLPGFLGEAMKGKGDATAALLAEANKAIGAAFEAAHPTNAPDAVAVAGSTAKGLRAAAAGKTQDELNDESLKRAKEFYDGLDQLEEHAAEQEAKLLAQRAKEQKAFVDAIEKHSTEAWDVIAKDEEKAQKQADEMAKAMEKSVSDALRKTEAEAQKAKHAADAIGSAFVNALSDQLQKLSSGGEFDIALFVGDLLAAAAATAASVIGAAYGMPALGSAVGNLAAMGIRAGAGAISAGNHKKYHSGGWVGDEAELPRYHSGTWVGPDEQAAILQRGERVLSRQEVGQMGGRAGVDRAVRGGPALNVNLMAIDSKSAAESFMTDLGVGLRRALRSGRGDVPAILGVPR